MSGWAFAHIRRCDVGASIHLEALIIENDDGYVWTLHRRWRANKAILLAHGKMETLTGAREAADSAFDIWVENYEVAGA